MCQEVDQHPEVKMRPTKRCLIHLTVKGKDPLEQQEDQRVLGTATSKPNFNLKKESGSVIGSEEKTKPETILITSTHAQKTTRVFVLVEGSNRKSNREKSECQQEAD